MANSFQKARELWSLAAELPAEEFQSRFDSLFATADSLPTLWQLGGAIGDYLRRYPAAVKMPPSLPETLLQSDHADARIVGLKLLNRAKTPAEQTAKWVVSALRSNSECELIGGLCELDEILKRANSRFDFESVKAALIPLSESSDDYVRRRADDYLYLIDSATQS